MKHEPTTPGSPETEYKIANDRLAHYSNLRLTQLTIYLGTMGALLAATLRLQAAEFKEWKILLAATGVGLTAFFWLNQERLIGQYNYFRERARTLEATLLYFLWTERPVSIARTRWIDRLLFIGMIALWIVVAALNKPEKSQP